MTIGPRIPGTTGARNAGMGTAMRAVVAGFLIPSLVAIATSADAMFVRLSEAELMAQSDVIIVGELIGHTEAAMTPGQPPAYLGVLRVEEVLKGAPGVDTLLLALPRPHRFARSTDLHYQPGQRGLWYLRVRDPRQQGIYAADHPQRFVPMAKAANQLRFLRKSLRDRRP